MASELSYSDKSSLLSATLNEGTGDGRYWVRDLYESSVVYQDKDGKIYRRTYVISPDDSATVTLGDPQEVIQQTSYEPVQMAAFSFEGEFSEGTDDSGEFITVKGKIFEAGDYPDKDFSLTAEEMALAVQNFKPVALDLEHTSTPLDGKLGRLEAVEVSENGRDLIGTVKFPKWLDNVLADMPRKVSSTWNRATKLLSGLALVNKPRVTDAALMSAFSQAQVEFAGKRNSGNDQKRIQDAHDNLVEAGATCTTEMSEENKDGGAASVTNNNAHTEEQPQMADNNEAQFTAADVAEFKAQMAAQNATIAQLKADRRHADAAAFAEQIVSAGRALPIAKSAIVVLFEQAALDDEARPEVAAFAGFSAGNGQLVDSRTKALAALFAAMPRSPLVQELVTATGEITRNAEGLVALFDNDPKRQETEEKAGEARRQEYMNQTPLGQAAAKAKSAGK